MITHFSLLTNLICVRDSASFIMYQCFRINLYVYTIPRDLSPASVTTLADFCVLCQEIQIFFSGIQE